MGDLMRSISKNHENLLKFKDILKERREGSDFWWISRAINFVNAFNNEKLLTPANLKQAVLRSHKLKHFIEEMSDGDSEPVQLLELKANQIIEEIGYAHRLYVIRWLGFILVKIMKRILLGLLVNEKKLLQIKSEMGTSPVVIVPTHRSYADFILMAFIFFNYGIQIPCVAAGMDFHSMWLMGKLLRDSKAFFMRRSFSDDSLYRKTFEQYVEKLISNGNSPVEFFIEGTRSRSSKPLMPKFGFLTMVMEAFYKGEVPDVTIIPVTISYERLLEETLFAYELLGVPKPKETTSGLFRAIKMLDQKYGHVFVDIGDPISVRDYLKNHDHSSRSKLKENNHIMHIGHTIIRRQQNMQVLGCFNMIAASLCNHLVLGQMDKFTYNQVCKDVVWISSILRDLGASVYLNDDVQSSVTLALKEHSNLVGISSDGTIAIVNANHTECDKNKLKGAVLSDQSLSQGVPVIMLQLYVNPCLYLIAGPAIILLLLEHSGQPVLKNDLRPKYKTLSEIFSHEFVFYSEWVHEEFENALGQLEKLDAILTCGNTISLGNNRKVSTLFQNLLYPFIVGYYSLSNTLLQETSINKSELSILKNSQEYIEKGILSGSIKHYYPLSLNLLACAINSLTTKGALSKNKNGTDVYYTVNVRTLEDIIKILGSVIPEGGNNGDSSSSHNFSLFNKSKL